MCLYVPIDTLGILTKQRKQHPHAWRRREHGQDRPRQSRERREQGEPAVYFCCCCSVCCYTALLLLHAAAVRHRVPDGKICCCSSLHLVQMFFSLHHSHTIYLLFTYVCIHWQFCRICSPDLPRIRRTKTYLV